MKIYHNKEVEFEFDNKRKLLMSVSYIDDEEHISLTVKGNDLTTSSGDLSTSTIDISIKDFAKVLEIVTDNLRSINEGV